MHSLFIVYKSHISIVFIVKCIVSAITEIFTFSYTINFVYQMQIQNGE